MLLKILLVLTIVNKQKEIIRGIEKDWRGRRRTPSFTYINMRCCSSLTCVLVDKLVTLDVILSEFSWRQHLDAVRHQLHRLPGEDLQLEVHGADLRVEWVVVEQVGAVELLAVGLAHGDDVFPSIEYLNLVNAMELLIVDCIIPLLIHYLL